jgi:hypothetical protein
MMKLIEMCHLNKVKKTRIFILILLMLALILFISKPDGTLHEIKMFKSDYYLYHMPLLQMVLLILSSSLITIFIYDHASSYLIPFHVEQLKNKLIIAKLVYALFYSVIIIIPSYIVFLIGPIYFNYQSENILTELVFIFDMTIDHFIMIVLILIFTHHKYEIIAYIFLIARVFLYFLYQDFHPSWFYLLPFIHHTMSTQNYYYHYKVLYLCLLIFIYYIKADQSEV